MNGATLDDKGVVVACSNCGRRNRIQYAQLGETIRCGNCKNALGGVNMPVEADSEEHFHALVNGSALPVLVDFWAPWCGPCKMVAPEFQKVAVSSAGKLLVAKVNTEAQPGLARRYEIQAIPTLILFQSGNEVARESGARPAESIQSFVQQALTQATH